LRRTWPRQPASPRRRAGAPRLRARPVRPREGWPGPPGDAHPGPRTAPFVAFINPDHSGAFQHGEVLGQVARRQLEPRRGGSRTRLGFGQAQGRTSYRCCTAQALAPGSKSTRTGSTTFGRPLTAGLRFQPSRHKTFSMSYRLATREQGQIDGSRYSQGRAQTIQDSTQLKSERWGCSVD
jgi:hypothetical protein